MTKMRVRRKLEEEEQQKVFEADWTLEQEAQDLLEGGGSEEEEEEQEGTSRSKDKPTGKMPPTSFWRYRGKLVSVLQRYSFLEQCDLAMFLAGAYSSPSLPCPLRPSKLTIRLSPASLQLHLKSNQ